MHRNDHEVALRAARIAELERAEYIEDRSVQLTNTMGVQWRPLPPEQPAIWPRDYITIPMVKQAPQRVRCTPQGDPMSLWWTVTANGSQVARVVQNEGDTPAAPLLDWSEIVTANGGVDSTDLQLQLEWDADSAVVDIGAGVQFSILAPIVTASLLVPSPIAARNANTSQVRSGVPLELGGNQILEAVASIGMVASEAPLGRRQTTCTRRYLVGETDVPTLGGGKSVTPAASTFQIPARAQWVTFYVGTGQVAPAAGIGPVFLRSAIGDTPIGQVDDWARRVSPRERVPQNATVIRLVGFEPGDQVTAVWELDL